MPMVDDPRDYGRIAAANSISDVYAMGARPIMALAIVGMPIKKLPPEVMADVLAGGAEVCAEAGIGIVGGHSIDDEELKFGLSVTGVVHPDHLLRNDRGQPGDLLVLTKPIGVGAVAGLVKKGTISEAVYAELIRVTTTLNRAASEVAVAHGLRCATDVTGFGLLGHAREIALGSGCALELWLSEVPVMVGGREAIASGSVPGATGRNLSFHGKDVVWDEVDEADRLLVADPQTSGGLLLAVAPEKLDAVVADLQARGSLAAAVVGRLGVGAGTRVVGVGGTRSTGR
jgi:selenide, water dikinase